MKESYPQVENTVGKGEIAHYEQFLLFPLCFQKACFPEASKGVIVWEWVNSYISVVVCIFFEFGTVSKWCIREWVNRQNKRAQMALDRSPKFFRLS